MLRLCSLKAELATDFSLCMEQRLPGRFGEESKNSD